jgi:hypothetical protein
VDHVAIIGEMRQVVDGEDDCGNDWGVPRRDYLYEETEDIKAVQVVLSNHRGGGQSWRINGELSVGAFSGEMNSPLFVAWRGEEERKREEKGVGDGVVVVLAPDKADEGEDHAGKGAGGERLRQRWEGGEHERLVPHRIRR